MHALADGMSAVVQRAAITTLPQSGSCHLERRPATKRRLAAAGIHDAERAAHGHPQAHAGAQKSTALRPTSAACTRGRAPGAHCSSAHAPGQADSAGTQPAVPPCGLAQQHGVAASAQLYSKRGVEVRRASKPPLTNGEAPPRHACDARFMCVGRAAASATHAHASARARPLPRQTQTACTSRSHPRQRHSGGCAECRMRAQQ